jgi:hypothetical protein
VSNIKQRDASDQARRWVAMATTPPVLPWQRSQWVRAIQALLAWLQEAP